MSGINTTLTNGLNKLFSLGGISTSVNIFSFDFIESDYDDEFVQTQTGSNVVSGITFPIKSEQGSSEALLLEASQLSKDPHLLSRAKSVLNNVTRSLETDVYAFASFLSIVETEKPANN